MSKSELIKKMTERLDQLTSRDVDLAVHSIIEIMSDSLATGARIEIRGLKYKIVAAPPLQWLTLKN